jgi:hypothetical protein
MPAAYSSTSSFSSSAMHVAYVTRLTERSSKAKIKRIQANAAGLKKEAPKDSQHVEHH